MKVTADPTRELAAVMARLVADSSTSAEQLQASDAFLALSKKLAWPSVTDEAVNTNTALPSGQALDPESASRCVGDYLRTRIYVRGLDAAITAARARFPGERLRVLYAGCGPLATLALHSIGHRPASDVGFTLVDIHRFSIESGKRLIRAFGFDDRIDEWIEGDATELSFPPERRFHVAVSEVMQRALDQEPQVAVSMALARHLVPGGILVPERIRVALETQGSHREVAAPGSDDFLTTAPLRHLATLIELTRDTRAVPPPQIVVVSEDLEDGAMAVLSTEIAVFGPEVLRPGDAGITCMKPLPQFGPLVPGDRIECRYRMGADPGFTCTLLNRPEGHVVVRRNGIRQRGDAADPTGPQLADPAPAEILGRADLARFWDRARRARAGVSAWSDQEIAQDADALADLGLSLEATMAFTFDGLPSPEEFAAWVRAQRGNG